MKRIHPSGAVETLPGEIPDSAFDGTGRVDVVEATYDTLGATFGPPNSRGLGKSCREWALETPDGIAAIYDYQEERDPSDIPQVTIRWSAGGRNRQVGQWVKLALAHHATKILVRLPKQEAVKVITEAARTIINPTSPDHGHKVICCRIGGIVGLPPRAGADWRLDEALELLDTARDIGWYVTDVATAHDLVVVQHGSGLVYRFAVRAPLDIRPKTTAEMIADARAAVAAFHAAAGSPNQTTAGLALADATTTLLEAIE